MKADGNVLVKSFVLAATRPARLKAWAKPDIASNAARREIRV